MLKSGRLEIESYNPFGFLSVSGMTPEPVAIDIRLLVTGSWQVYSLLTAYDPDFSEVFKVLADFVPEEPRSETAELAYARHGPQTQGVRRKGQARERQGRSCCGRAVESRTAAARSVPRPEAGRGA